MMVMKHVYADPIRGRLLVGLILRLSASSTTYMGASDTTAPRLVTILVVGCTLSLLLSSAVPRAGELMNVPSAVFSTICRSISRLRQVMLGLVSRAGGTIVKLSTHLFSDVTHRLNP
jgi:hypothetical protein